MLYVCTLMYEYVCYSVRPRMSAYMPAHSLPRIHVCVRAHGMNASVLCCFAHFITMSTFSSRRAGVGQESHRRCLELEGHPGELAACPD